MARKEDLIAAIVQAEWRMFEAVPNISGTASCQTDPKTFEIMRSSQAMSWSEATLESYLRDLADAEVSGRNLLTEKYGRMMQSTAPSEYAAIEHLLPALDPELSPLIDEIVAVVLQWETELSVRFPHVLERGRPIHASGDGPLVTSLETYLRGELATYSRRTLELYLENVRQQAAEQVNGSEVTLSHTMQRYGFESLAAANQRLAARRRG